MRLPFLHTHAMKMLLLQCASILPMCGLIWFVQLVHYPLLALVGEHHLQHYAIQHARRTTWVVGPLMLLELASSIGLLFAPLRPAAVSAASAWCGAMLLALIWLSTALLQVPLHTRLQEGEPARLVTRLAGTNWIRTGLWTARALLVLFWIEHACRV